MKSPWNKCLSPDPDHLRGGPSHGYNTSCVKNKSIGAIVFGLHVRSNGQTDPRSGEHLLGWRHDGGGVLGNV